MRKRLELLLIVCALMIAYLLFKINLTKQVSERVTATVRVINIKLLWQCTRIFKITESFLKLSTAKLRGNSHSRVPTTAGEI